MKELDGIVNVDGRVTETYNLEIGRIGRHINRMLVYQNQLIKRDQERQKIIFRMEWIKRRRNYQLYGHRLILISFTILWNV